MKEDNDANIVAHSWGGNNLKSIIITGAGSGLGKELALLYASQGFHIILIGRTMKKLKVVEEQIQANNGHADSYTVDITDKKSVQNFIKEVANHFNLYGLINNAGVGHFGPFENLKQDEMEEMISTNVLGTIYMTQAILPFLKEKNNGLLMNIISTAGLTGKVNETGYVASKFAVRGLTESLQKEYENTGLEIKDVYMGGMDTPFWENSTHIKDKSGLRSATEIAKIIYEHQNEKTIIIESKG